MNKYYLILKKKKINFNFFKNNKKNINIIKKTN